MTTTSVPSGGLSRIPGDRGRMLRGIELANRKHSEYGYTERISRVGDGKYRVPSRTTDERYLVDLGGETPQEICPCRDAEFGHYCYHYYGALIKEARRAVALSRPVRCSCCGNKHPLGETRELTPEDLEHTLAFREGERLCSVCMTVAGVAN